MRSLLTCYFASRFMTSVSPYPEEVRLVQRRNSLNGKTSRPLSEYSDAYNNQAGLTNRRNSTNQHQHFAQDNLESYDNALPWNAKDSKNDKNFYETYSKENDRRKREGNVPRYELTELDKDLWSSRFFAPIS